MFDFTDKERVFIVVIWKIQISTHAKRCKRATSADIGNFRVYRKRVSK